VRSISQGLYNGLIELFAIGTDGQVYSQKFDTSGNKLAGFALVAPGAVKSATATLLPGSPALFAVGMDSQIYKLNLSNSTGDALGGYAATGSGAIS
jgi:hypothetical protein